MKKCMIPLFLISFLSFGQGPNLGLQSIEAIDETRGFVEAEMIFQNLKELFVNSNRFNILDRESLGIVLDEQEIQKQITSINAEVVNQGHIAGAQHIIGGKLMSLEYKKVKGLGKTIEETLFGGDTKASDEILYRPVFTFSLNIINTESSKTEHTKTFRVGTLSTGSIGGLTEQEAFQNALNGLKDEITRDFINKFLPLEISIVAIEEEKNGEATVLLINTGNASGTDKNDRFKVYHISTLDVDGKEMIREKEIAEIKILDVEGEELSTAKVLKGGNDLLAIYNTGETLICKSN